MKITYRAFTLLFLLLTAYTANATDIIKLRTDCNDQGTACYTDTTSLLNWLWNIRNPSATSPVLVDIGPGNFDLYDANGYICDANGVTDGKGYVTFGGSGIDITTLTAFLVRDCTNLTFQNLSIDGHNVWPGVEWQGGGESTWSDIFVKNGGGYGWIDECSSTGAKGSHYWYSSKIERTMRNYGFAYRTQCGETWFYGGEISTIFDGGGKGGSTIFGTSVYAGVGGSINIFGSTVRSIATANEPTGNSDSDAIDGQGGLFADGGVIHMHGGIVSVRAENDGVTRHVFGARAIAGGIVHTPGTAYGLKASGGGSVKRVRVSGGVVGAPFQWPANVVPPSDNFASDAGQDTYVETDCSSNGASSGGTEPHLMIYSAACATEGPWFDSTTGRCRGVIQ